MVPRENKNNAFAKFGGTNKEYYGIFPSGNFPSGLWELLVLTSSGSRPGGKVGARSQTFCFCPFKVLVALVQI